MNHSRILFRGRRPISLRNLWSQFGSQNGAQPKCHPEPPEAELGGVPDLVQPIEGWRVWKIVTVPTPHHDLPLLRSVILDTPWTPRRKVAAEHNFDLETKCQGLLKSSCSCGVHAFKDPSDAFVYLVGVRDRLLGAAVDTALGAVSLWGKVVECERGYRAQFAYPRHIYLPATAYHRVTDVSSAFGVPVGVHASAYKGQMSIAQSNHCGDQWFESLAMKKSRELEIKQSLYKVGFYDQQTFMSYHTSAP